MVLVWPVQLDISVLEAMLHVWPVMCHATLVRWLQEHAYFAALTTSLQQQIQHAMFVLLALLVQ